MESDRAGGVREDGSPPRDRRSLLIVDDHALFATAMSESLRVRGFEVHVATTFVVEELVGEVRALGASMVLLDLYLAGQATSLPLVEPLVATGATVVLLTGSDERMLHADAIRRGATAVLNKAMPFDALLDSLQRIALGDLPDLQRQELLAELDATERADRRRLEPFNRLTRREAIVLLHLMDGQSPADIAAKEHVALTTVRSQLASIFSKLGVRSQREAITAAHRAEWPPADGGRDFISSNDDGGGTRS